MYKCTWSMFYLFQCSMIFPWLTSKTQRVFKYCFVLTSLKFSSWNSIIFPWSWSTSEYQFYQELWETCCKLHHNHIKWASHCWSFCWAQPSYAITHFSGMFHGPSLRIFDWICYQATPIYEVDNPNWDMLQHIFSHCGWMSLWCLVL